MIISYEALYVLMRDWIKVEEALTHGYIGKFDELGCFPSGIAGEGFGFTYTYLPTNYSKETGTIYARRALNEEKWLIFMDHLGFMHKPVIEIWDDRIDVHLDEDRLNGWKKDRIHSLYELLKPYVLFDIDESSMDERNAQAVVLGRCVTNWLDENRPFFANCLEPGSKLQNWSITYASDDDNYISWDISPSFKIRMVTGNHARYYLYGQYIPHDNSDMDDKPYWIISDQEINLHPEINIQKTEPAPMFIYIYRNHIEYKRPGRDDYWFEGYMKGLTDDIRAAMKGTTIPDCSRTIKRLYESGALKCKRAEESLTTKRGELVRHHNNSYKIIIDSMDTKLDNEEGNSMKISIDDVYKHVETWVAQFKEKYVSEGGEITVQHLNPCAGRSAYKEGYRISFRQPDNCRVHLIPFDLTIRKIHTSDEPDSIRIYNPNAPGVPYENAIITIYDDRIEYFEKHDNIKWFDRISMFNLYFILVLALDDHEIAYDNIVSKSLLFSYMHKWVAPKIELFMGDLRSPDAERRSFRAVYNIGYWSSFNFNFHEDRDICPISKILNVEAFTLYRGCLGSSNRWHICTHMDGNQILAIIRERDSEIRRCTWGPAKLCTLSANNRWSDSECEDLFKMLSHLVEEDARNHGFDSDKIPSVDKEKKKMDKLISQSELRSIMQKWIDPFIERYDVDWSSGGWEGGFCWFLGGHYSNRGRSIFAHLCNDKFWKIYQNGNQDTPCCEIYSDEIRIYDMSGNFDAFSLPEIKILCERIREEYFKKNEKDDEDMHIPGGQAIEYPGSATIDLNGSTEKRVNAVAMGIMNDAVAILKKTAGTVWRDSPTTTDVRSKMLKSMNRRDLKVILNSTYGLTQAGVTVDHDDSSIYPDTKRGFSMKIMQNIKEVIVNPPATIVYWEDGTKTTSHCKDDEVGGFDAEIGLAICIAKKYFGGTENLQLEARRAAVRYERREKKRAKKASKKKTEETVTEAKPVAKKKPTPKKK